MQASVSSQQAEQKNLVDAADPLVRDLGGVMKYLLHTGREFYELVAELDLSLTQMRALNLLCLDDGEASFKQLADALGLSLPAVSRSIDGLVQRGLATRSENTEDRRLKTVRPTDEAYALVNRMIELRLAGLEDFVATLSPDERAKLAAALAPLVEREEIALMRARGYCSAPSPSTRKDSPDA